MITNCLKGRTFSILRDGKSSLGTVESIFTCESVEFWQHGGISRDTVNDTNPHSAMLWLSVSLRFRLVQYCVTNMADCDADFIFLSVLLPKCSIWSRTPGIAIQWIMTPSGSSSLLAKEGWRSRCLVPSSMTPRLLWHPRVSPSPDSGTMKVGEKDGSEAMLYGAAPQGFSRHVARTLAIFN